MRVNSYTVRHLIFEIFLYDSSFYSFGIHNNSLLSGFGKIPLHIRLKSCTYIYTHTKCVYSMFCLTWVKEEDRQGGGERKKWRKRISSLMFLIGTH